MNAATSLSAEPAPRAVPAPVAENASEHEDSEELDDSDGKEWSDDDKSVEEVLTGESAESEAEEEDLSINLIDFDVVQRVTAVIREDECKKRCLEGKASELQWLICSLEQMSMSEKTTCILTLLGVLMQTDTAARQRET